MDRNFLDLLAREGGFSCGLLLLDYGRCLATPLRFLLSASSCAYHRFRQAASHNTGPKSIPLGILRHSERHWLGSPPGSKGAFDSSRKPDALASSNTLLHSSTNQQQGDPWCVVQVRRANSPSTSKTTTRRTVRGRDNCVESRMNRFIALLLLAVGLVLPAQAVLTGDIKSCSG